MEAGSTGFPWVAREQEAAIIYAKDGGCARSLAATDFVDHFLYIQDASDYDCAR